VIEVAIVTGIIGALTGIAVAGWLRDRRRRGGEEPPGDPWTVLVRELRSARVADDPGIPDNRQRPRRL
jgi:hypothetical protein